MNMNEYNYTSAALELFAAIVTAMMLFGYLLERKKGAKNSRLFAWCLAVNTAMLLSDAPIWVLLANPSPERVIPIKILSFFSAAFFCAIISLYAYCLTEHISEIKKISYNYAHVITAFCGVALLLYFINIFNGMYIYYDETGLDKTGPMFLLSQAISVILPAMTMILALKHHGVLGWRKTWTMVLFGAIPVLSIPLQFYWTVTPVYFAVTVSLVLVYMLIRVEQAGRSANIEKELIKKELALSESNNALVLSQIQPHFLYNVLTSIYRLCDVKPEAAKEAVSNFSKYLRGNLDSIKQTEMISFAEELKHLQAYLALEKIRYGDYLKVEYNIEVAGFFIPPLTVQPLAENAVNHGVSDLPDGGVVTICTAETPDCYEIRVCDNGIGFNPDSVQSDGRTHVGISNVRSRLEIMCGGTLDITSDIGKGTTAIIKIPKGETENERYSGRR